MYHQLSSPEKWKNTSVPIMNDIELLLIQVVFGNKIIPWQSYVKAQIPLLKYRNYLCHHKFIFKDVTVSVLMADILLGH